MGTDRRRAGRKHPAKADQRPDGVRFCGPRSRRCLRISRAPAVKLAYGSGVGFEGSGARAAKQAPACLPAAIGSSPRFALAFAFAAAPKKNKGCCCATDRSYQPPLFFGRAAGFALAGLPFALAFALDFALALGDAPLPLPSPRGLCDGASSSTGRIFPLKTGCLWASTMIMTFMSRA